MIALIETRVGISRLEHLLALPAGIPSSSPCGTIVSLDPTARAAAHDLGFAVMPVVVVEQSITARRRQAATRLKTLKTTLLTKSWIAKAAARWVKPLNIVYRAVQAPLQGRTTSKITRHVEALSAALRTVDPASPVYVDSPFGALVAEMSGVASNRLTIL